jgi:hypothetical protein
VLGEDRGNDAVVRQRITLAVVLAMMLLAVPGCGSSGSSSSSPPSRAAGGAPSSTTGRIKLAKTKFVLHAGLAFGAFHRWIYKPAKAGTLRHPFAHPLTAAKAALAAAFVYHELKLALANAQSDPTLSKLVAPITALRDKIHGLSGSVKSGGVSGTDASGLDGTISSTKGQASGAGATINEQTPGSPSG